MKRALTASLATVCAAIALAATPAANAAVFTPPQFCSGLTDTCQPAALTPAIDAASLAADVPFSHPCHGLIPDVSNWQRHVDWAAAAGCGVAGGIFKAGEGLATDAYASDNNSQLRSLHLWHAMYWYIRNSGCQAEADAIAREAHALAVTVVVNDLESPSDDAGYGACLPPLEKKAGLSVVDYTSPGTWNSSYGGFAAVPLWQAEYGPTLHPLWHPVVAWQCTDGHFGCVTNIPGIGQDDVSRDLGITKLGPAPRKTVCFGKGAQNTPTCRFVRGEIVNWTGEDNHVHRLWIDLGAQAHQLRCLTPYKRISCKAFGQTGGTLSSAAGSLRAQIHATEKKYGQ